MDEETSGVRVRDERDRSGRGPVPAGVTTSAYVRAQAYVARIDQLDEASRRRPVRPLEVRHSNDWMITGAGRVGT